MGFKPKDVKYRQERKQNTNMSGRQGWPLRQAWGNQSNLHPPGLEWEFPNFSIMGWDTALGPAAAEPGRVGKPQASLSLRRHLKPCKGDAQHSVRINLSWICNTSRVPAWLHFPFVAQVTHGRKPCGHLWRAGAELQTPPEPHRELGWMGKWSIWDQWMKSI